MKMKKEASNAKKMYLELLKKAILFEIWIEHERNFYTPDNKIFNPTHEQRNKGLDWPPIAHSMIGRKRMNHLHFCMNRVIKEQIPGDFIETGVWRGGACIFMNGFLKAHNIRNRKVWLADSFEGLPANDPKYPADKNSPFHTFHFLRVSLKEVKENFRKYDLLDHRVQFLKGWFKDTLPNAPIKKIAIARLDGDMYQSTMDSLVNLYHKISDGGYIIIDDWSIPSCRKAVEDFRKHHRLTEPLVPIDSASVYWRKKR